MKALLLVILPVGFLVACDVVRNTSSNPSPDGDDAAATPRRVVGPTPTPKPKPGEWMFKNYKNPLDQKPAK